MTDIECFRQLLARFEEKGNAPAVTHLTALLSALEKDEKPFECWVNRYRFASPQAFETQAEADAEDRLMSQPRIGPALHMREVKP